MEIEQFGGARRGGAAADRGPGMSGFESYLRHGRRYGVDADFWQAASGELDPGELRRLARALDARLPRKLVEAGHMPRQPASGAGAGVDIGESGPTGRRPASPEAGAPVACPRSVVRPLARAEVPAQRLGVPLVEVDRAAVGPADEVLVLVTRARDRSLTVKVLVCPGSIEDAPGPVVS